MTPPSTPRRALGLLVGLVVLLASACGPSLTPAPADPDAQAGATAGFPVTVTDRNGDPLTFGRAPQRVCLMSSTALNIWYDVGGKAVCAPEVTENLKVPSAYADELRRVPSIGKQYAVNLEALVGANPDLVIATESFGSDAIDRLRKQDITVFTIRTKTMADLTATYEAFGKIAGHPERAAERLTAITKKVNGVVAKMPPEPKRVVILYATSKALAVKLDNSIAGDAVKRLGLVNIASDKVPDNPGSETTPLDVEEIIRAKPDVVLVTTMITNNDDAQAVVSKQFEQNPAWQAVEAIREGRVAFLPQQYFLLNAGPYYGESIEYLAASTHPEIFGPPVAP